MGTAEHSDRSRERENTSFLRRSWVTFPPSDSHIHHPAADSVRMAPTLWLVLAVALLALGVVGSVTPLVPGPLLSVAGVCLYWWSTGFGEPGLAFVVGVVIVGLGAVLVDWLAGAISSKAGGASTTSAVVAAVVGVLAFFVAGPLGIVIAVAVAVFATEFYLGGDLRTGVRASLYATVGLLASSVVQLLVTFAVLVGFLLVLAV